MKSNMDDYFYTDDAPYFLFASSVYLWVTHLDIVTNFFLLH